MAVGVVLKYCPIFLLDSERRLCEVSFAATSNSGICFLLNFVIMNFYSVCIGSH